MNFEIFGHKNKKKKFKKSIFWIFIIFSNTLNSDILHSSCTVLHIGKYAILDAASASDIINFLTKHSIFPIFQRDTLIQEHFQSGL